MKSLRLLNLILLLMGLTFVSFIAAQDDSSPELTLRLSRDFGYGLRGQMQGYFSYRVNGANLSEFDELAKVEFLLDGQVIGEDTTAPFQWKFNTADFELGTHQLSAVGYASSGQELNANTITRQFVSGRSVIWIALAIVALVIGFRLVSYILTRSSASGGKAKTGYGYLGGAVCPNCGHPFGLHLWSIKLVAGRLDRCPYCGKWNLVRRSSPEALTHAESLAGEKSGTKQTSASESYEHDQRERRLEDSRYDNR